MIQTKLVKNIPNQWFEYFGEPLYRSLAYLLPFHQKSEVIYSGQHFTAPWGFASGWADSISKMKSILALGSGAVVSKTITVKPRKGNPYPRFHRWKHEMVNSMGLPNNGLAWWIQELRKEKRISENFIFSIKGDTVPEWKLLLKNIAPFSKIIELNFSCPNVTSGIIDIPKTVKILKNIRTIAPNNKLYLKISPEFSIKSIINFLYDTRENGLIDGLTCFNTYPVKVDYVGNKDKNAGLSGLPLKRKVISTIKEIRAVYKTEEDLGLFGLGGIANVQDAVLMYKKYHTYPFVFTAFLLKGPLLFRDWYFDYFKK